ncbi:MAG: ketopantoate reductase family protein [Acidobacteriota bacterium]
MKIAVVGAGGVGGYFAAALSKAGHEVKLLARGAHRDAIRSHGLRVVDPDGEWTAEVDASDDPRALLPAELAIVAVKSYSIPEIAPAVSALAAAGAVVLPLLNGVEAGDALAARGVPRASLLAGLVFVGVEKTGPGVITRKSRFQTIVLGEPGGGPSDRAERVAQALRDAGADASVSNEIILDLWRKFLFLTTFATAAGLSRAPIGPIREAPLGRLLLERAAREIGDVARARGIDLPESEEREALVRLNALEGGLTPSFLLDLERGGPTELDVLTGAVSRYGRESGVETPIHDAATAAFGAAQGRKTTEAPRPAGSLPGF